MKTLLLLLLSYTFVFANNQSTMKSYIEKTGIEPVKYVIEKFKDKDLVVFSDIHKVKHEIEFISYLLPALNAEGIHTLAVECGNTADQPKMDKLLNSSSFDNELAIEILRNYRCDGIMGYQEYLNVYKTAWQLNQTGKNKFNVILLGGTKTPVELNGKALIVAKNVTYKNAYTIVFHTALQKDMVETFDQISSKTPVAFDIKGSPAKIDADGYIYLKQCESFEPLTWIDGFVDESYLPAVKKYYKDLNVETLEYANDICKANGWTNYEMVRGTKLN